MFADHNPRNFREFVEPADACELCDNAVEPIRGERGCMCEARCKECRRIDCTREECRA